MNIPFIDLNAQYLSIKNEIDAAISRVVSKGNFILGPEVKAFEEEMSSYLGINYAVGVASGTDALHLALLACGVITGYGAVVNKAKVKPGQSCVVIGVGGVGLNAIQGASISGAYPVIAVDMLDNKLEAAKEFGATHVVNGSKDDPVEKVKELTGGYGADYVIITVGVTPAIAQAIAMLARQGTAVIVGLATTNLEVFPMDIIDFEKVITASFMGTTNLSQDIPKLVALYQAGILKLDELITAHYPLDEINDAIDAVTKGAALRNIITFT